MNLYAVFVDNINENTVEIWMVKASSEEEARAIIDRDLKSWGDYTVIKISFLREAIPADTEAMECLEAKLVYSWEKE